MVDSKYNLPVIDVPGLAEARQREHELRDLAFLPIGEEIAGVKVRPYAPVHLLALDALKNGFVVPCVFERPTEKAAHALQFLWIVSHEYRLPTGWFDSILLRFKRWRFIKNVSARNGYDIYTGIARYLNDAMMDCPGSDSDEPKQERQVAHASYMATIVDTFYAAGYPWTEQDILDMPFKKLWQYLRLSMRRLDPELTLSNPSDRLARRHVAKLNMERANVG